MAKETGLSSATLKSAVVTGAAVDTDIAVAGLTMNDVLISVVAFDGDGASLAVQVIDCTGEASITSAGKIQLTTTATGAYRLLVIYQVNDKIG